MRFSYAESMTDPSFYLPLARAAEEAGFDSMVVPDSICYPEESDARYPFNPDGTREFLEDKPFLEPFSLIPAMGAVTEQLRFVTFVVKLPIRHPVLVAKQVSSTAVLTDNRLLLGVGTSPWPEDYAVCGVPWEGRGKRMDEQIDVMRGPDGRRVLRVPRRCLRRPVDQDEPDADQAGADPDRWPPRGGAPPGRPSAATAGCTAAGTRPTCPGLLERLAGCGASTARATSRSRSTSSRSTPTAPTASSGWRSWG